MLLSSKKIIMSIINMIKNYVKLPRIVQPSKYKDISESKFSEKQGLFVEKPSKRLTKIKTIDPFANKSKLNAYCLPNNIGILLHMFMRQGEYHVKLIIMVLEL